jgi:N-acetylglucosamine malate deacetylase 1
MNVLVIAPHPDDEVLGCGGTICLHRQRGDSVHVAFLTSGELGLKHLPPDQAWRVREREAERAAEVLGFGLTFLRLPDWFLGESVPQAVAALGPILLREAPQRLYLPHPLESHPDHQAALSVVRAALEQNPSTQPALHAYEVWTPLAAYDFVEDITPWMRRKLQAVHCYESQLGQFRYDRAVRGLNQYRGALAARCRYAEVFLSVVPEPTPVGESANPSRGTVHEPSL